MNTHIIQIIFIMRKDRAIQLVFIRPFKKRTYYAVAMSVRPSVRPSVLPRFPDFSSTCFEKSIWNLVYTFSRWHDMSSLSCITIGSLWPSLQPKVGQTHFCNHGLINQDIFFKFGTQVACCILIRHKFRFCKNNIFRILAIIFVRFGFLEVFLAFFSTCFKTSVWNLVYTCSRWCYTSSSSFIPIGTLWPTLQPKIGQSHLSAFMALKII